MKAIELILLGTIVLLSLLCGAALPPGVRAFFAARATPAPEPVPVAQSFRPSGPDPRVALRDLQP